MQIRFVPSSRKTNRWILYRKTVSICCENYRRHKYSSAVWAKCRLLALNLEVRILYKDYAFEQHFPTIFQGGTSTYEHVYRPEKDYSRRRGGSVTIRNTDTTQLNITLTTNWPKIKKEAAGRERRLLQCCQLPDKNSRHTPLDIWNFSRVLKLFTESTTSRGTPNDGLRNPEPWLANTDFRGLVSEVIIRNIN